MMFDALSSVFDNIKIEEITISGDIEKGFEIVNKPKSDGYDIVIFASWVMAFSLNPVIKKYLSDLNALENKKIFCIVTQHFPYKWMGGTLALGQMKKLINTKNGVLQMSDVINWTNKNRDNQIREIITNIIQNIK